MTINELVALVSGLGGFIIAMVALWQKASESKRNSRVLEASEVLKGYSQLADDLREQIAVNNTEIKRLKRELIELRKQTQEDREAWEQERADLRAQIVELQEENKRLHKLIEGFKIQAGG